MVRGALSGRRRWTPLLADCGAAYLPYLHANAVAWRDGRTRLDVEVQGARYRNLPAVQYRVWCRERLQQHFEALPEAAQPTVRALLESHGCWEPLWRDGRIASNLHTDVEPPLGAPAPERGWRALRALQASPWNRPLRTPRLPVRHRCAGVCRTDARTS